MDFYRDVLFYTGVGPTQLLSISKDEVQETTIWLWIGNPTANNTRDHHRRLKIGEGFQDGRPSLPLA